jgi:hypothetical protein
MCSISQQQKGLDRGGLLTVDGGKGRNIALPYEDR